MTPIKKTATPIDAPAVPEAPPPAGAPIPDVPELPRRSRKVRALKPCYYDDRRRRIGDVFSIRPPYQITNANGKVITIDEFSKTGAMEDVSPTTPDRITSGKEDLQRQHDETLAQRHPTGDKHVIGSDE